MQLPTNKSYSYVRLVFITKNKSNAREKPDYGTKLSSNSPAISLVYKKNGEENCEHRISNY